MWLETSISFSHPGCTKLLPDDGQKDRTRKKYTVVSYKNTVWHSQPWLSIFCSSQEQELLLPLADLCGDYGRISYDFQKPCCQPPTDFECLTHLAGVVTTLLPIYTSGAEAVQWLFVCRVVRPEPSGEVNKGTECPSRAREPRPPLG